MAQTWVSASASGPSAGQVIVDSGAMGSYGVREFQVILDASLAASFLIQKRNAANSSNLNEQRVSITANDAVSFGKFTTVLDTNERIRVVMDNALTLGNVSVSLFIQDA